MRKFISHALILSIVIIFFGCDSKRNQSYNLWVEFGNKGEFDEAILNYVKAIKINPNFAETYNYMGNLLRQIGKVK